MITPRFAAADGGRKLDGSNSVRNIDLLNWRDKMYYEEKIVNGVLCFRTMPNTPFVEFSKERLTAKIKELELKLQSQEKPSLYEKAPWWANPDLPKEKITC